MQLFEFVKGHSYQQFKLLAKMMFSWLACRFCGSSIAALAEPNFWEKKLMQNTPLIATLPTTVSPKRHRLEKKNGESVAGPSDFQ